MGNKAVKAHCDTAAKTGLLTLTGRSLKTLPDGVNAQTLPSIRTLDISDNKFSVLPDLVCEFKALKVLNIGSNKLESLPEKLSQLNKLEQIWAGCNLIMTLPKAISTLNNLKQLYLNDNRLSRFPLEVLTLKHLDVLELSRNKIVSIPPEIRELNVIELNMNQNQVSSVAKEVADCPRLKVLRLEENCLPLTGIPNSLLVESKVHTLCLDGNLFDSKQLMALDGYDAYMERFTAVKKKMF